MLQKDYHCKCGNQKSKEAETCIKCRAYKQYKDLKIKCLCAIYSANKLGFYPSREDIRNLLKEEEPNKINVTLDNLLVIMHVVSRNYGYRIANRGLEFFKRYEIDNLEFFLDV